MYQNGTLTVCPQYVAVTCVTYTAGGDGVVCSGGHVYLISSSTLVQLCGDDLGQLDMADFHTSLRTGLQNTV